MFAYLPSIVFIIVGILCIVGAVYSLGVLFFIGILLDAGKASQKDFWSGLVTMFLLLFLGVFLIFVSPHDSISVKTVIGCVVGGLIALVLITVRDYLPIRFIVVFILGVVAGIITHMYFL